MNVVAFPRSAAETSAGRICPRDYTYSPAELARAADFSADTRYVVGGLYGNLAALEEIEKLATAERRPPEIVFNGDFHWFDAEPGWFASVERGVTPHRALRGNVETEISRADDIGAGCGCAYPDNVDDDVVRRSNEILAQLRVKIAPAARAPLRELPMHLVAQVGALRIGIVHGDAVVLAGWRFAYDALDEVRHRPWLDDVARAAQVDVFASTHTCLAALRDIALSSGRLTIVNNGAAGMPNFAGSCFGIVTRIATSPSPHQPLFGLARDGVHIDAIAVAYDHDDFLDRFLKRWPQGSPAHASYYRRIVDGPDYTIGQAAPR
jgi:predicted phosphodiesterase